MADQVCSREERTAHFNKCQASADSTQTCRPVERERGCRKRQFHPVCVSFPVEEKVSVKNQQRRKRKHKQVKGKVQPKMIQCHFHLLKKKLYVAVFCVYIARVQIPTCGFFQIPPPFLFLSPSPTLIPVCSSLSYHNKGKNAKNKSCVNRMVRHTMRP